MPKSNIDIFNEIGQSYENVSFKQMRKKSVQSHRDLNSTKTAYNKSVSTGGELRYIQTREGLTTFIQSSLQQSDRAATLSKELFAINANYRKMIEYYTNMYLFRHITSLDQIDHTKEVADADLMETYNFALNLVDGLTIDIMYKRLIKELYLSGAVYITTSKQTGAKTISTLVLPKAYCRTITQTNFQTNIIEFNFKFFDQFKDTFETDNSIFNIFPKEFETLYNVYKENPDKKKKPEWQALDPRTSTSILANEQEVPPILSALFGIRDYESYQLNELQKSDNQLEKILVHKIDTYEGELIFPLPEVKAMHKAMQKIASGNDKFQVLTTFGQTELLDLQKDAAKENAILDNAYQNIFNSAGLNNNLFTSNTVTGLEIALRMDSSIVWNFIEQMSNFFSLALNKYYNVNPLQMKIRVLNITVYNETEKTEQYLNSAQYGIGVTEAIVAQGIPQREIETKLKIEGLLDFGNKLKPLMSSHTQSGKETGSETAETEDKTAQKKEDETTKTDKKKQTEEEVE